MILHDENFLPMAFQLIHNANRSICISTFKAEITHKKRGMELVILFEELIRKKRQGVDVKFIINYHADQRLIPKTNIYVINYLKDNDIEVRSLRLKRCNHAKIVMVDTEQAIIGSHNLSVKSVNNNFEVSYLVKSIVDVCYLQSVFDTVWLSAKLPF